MDRWADIKGAVLLRPWSGLCERCGDVPPVEAHHRWLRGQLGPDLPSNLAALCRGCHDWCHDHPAAAVAEGWILQAPYDLLVPVRIAGPAGAFTARLTDDYGYDIIDWAA